jgi:hypothetical protein
MVTASVRSLAYNANGSHVYNLCYLAVLFLQARRGPDLILAALAGRVGNVVGLHRPRTRRSLLFVSDVELSLSHTPLLCSFVHDHVIIPDGSTLSLTFQPRVSLSPVMSQKRKLSYTFFLGSRNF